MEYMCTDQSREFCNLNCVRRILLFFCDITLSVTRLPLALAVCLLQRPVHPSKAQWMDHGWSSNPDHTSSATTSSTTACITGKSPWNMKKTMFPCMPESCQLILMVRCQVHASLSVPCGSLIPLSAFPQGELIFGAI